MQGLVPGKKRVLTAAGVEASQAPLIGHHQLTVGLLRANLLSPNARIVIAGAEPARGDVPMFSYTDVPAFAAKHHQGDRTAAVEALMRNGPNVKYVPNRTYADAKLIVAWWVAALARRLPSGMAVYAVSPGSAPDTKVVRNAWAGHEAGDDSTREPHSRHESDAGDRSSSGISRPRSSEPTSRANSSPRRRRSSQAQSRRCATRTFTIAPTKKPPGRPSSRSLASISLPQQLESGVLKESPIAAGLIPVTRISRRLRSYMIVHGVLRYFENN